MIAIRKLKLTYLRGPWSSCSEAVFDLVGLEKLAACYMVPDTSVVLVIPSRKLGTAIWPGDLMLMI